MAGTSASGKAKKKLPTVLKAIEKKYGNVHVLPGEPVLDQAIYLILRENWDYRKASKALQVLQREYVDWNEIRVTTAGELLGLLTPLGDREVEIKVEKIRLLLAQLYQERNRVTLDFLEEADADEQKSYLENLRVLVDEQVDILVLLLGAEGGTHGGTRPAVEE